MWERLWSDRESTRSLTNTHVDNPVSSAIRGNWYDRCYYVYSTTRLVVRVCGSDAGSRSRERKFPVAARKIPNWLDGGGDAPEG